jgi:hypothetical protein
VRFGTFTNPLASLFGNLGQGLGFPVTGFPTTGFPTTGFPTTGFPTTGFPTTGFPTTGFPTTGFPTTGFPTTGFPTTTVPTTLPTTTFPTTAGTPSFGGLQCFTGRVNILVFIQQSDVVATLTTQSGQTIFLTTNSPIIRQQLGQVDNRFATVCGNFVIRQGRLVLNVQVVIPQQVTPPVNLQQLLLILLLLLFLRGQLPLSGLGTTGLGALVSQFGGATGLQQALTQFGGAAGLTNLVAQMGGEQAIRSQLQSAGVQI